MTDIFADQIRSGDFNQLPLFQDADSLHHTGNQSGDRRLTGTRIACEDHMFGDLIGLKAFLFSDLVDLDQVFQRKQIILDIFQTDDLIEFLLDLFSFGFGIIDDIQIQRDLIEGRFDRICWHSSCFKAISTISL